MKQVKPKKYVRLFWISMVWQKKHTCSAPSSIVEINMTPTRGPQCLSLDHFLQILLAHSIVISEIFGVQSSTLDGFSSDSRNI